MNNRELDYAIHKELGYVWNVYKCEICGKTFHQGPCPATPKPTVTAIEGSVPHYSTNGEDMLLLIWEMRTKGYWMELSTKDRDVGCLFFTIGNGGGSWAYNQSVPMAVALAAHNALIGGENN